MAQIFIKIYGRPNSGYENIIDSGDCSFYNIDDKSLLGDIEQYFSIVSRESYVIYKLIVNNIKSYNNGRSAALHFSFGIHKGYKLENEKSPYDVLMRLKKLFFERYLEKSHLDEKSYTFKTPRIDKEDAQTLCNEIKEEFPLTQYVGPYRYMRQSAQHIGGITLENDRIQELMKDINYPQFENYCEIVIANRIDSLSINPIKDITIPRKIIYTVKIDSKSTPDNYKIDEKITVTSNKDRNCYEIKTETFTIQELLNGKKTTSLYKISQENETLEINTSPLATAKTEYVKINVTKNTNTDIRDLIIVWYEKGEGYEKKKRTLKFENNSFNFKLEGDEISDFKNGKYTIKISTKDNKLKLSGDVRGPINNYGEYQIITTKSPYQWSSDFSYTINIERIKPQPKEQPVSPVGGQKKSNVLTVLLDINTDLKQTERDKINSIKKIILKDGRKELKIENDYRLKPDKKNYNLLKAEIPLPDDWDLYNTEVSIWIDKKKYKPKQKRKIDNNPFTVNWSDFKDEWSIDLPTVSVTVLLSTILTLLLCTFLLGTCTGYVNERGIKKIFNETTFTENTDDTYDSDKETNNQTTDSIIEKAREGYKSLTTKGLDLTFKEIEELNQFKTKNDSILWSCKETDVKNFYYMITEYYSFVDALEKQDSASGPLKDIKSDKLSDVHKKLLEKLKKQTPEQHKKILPVNSFKDLEEKLNPSHTQLPKQGAGNTSDGTAGSSSPSSPQSGNKCKYCKRSYNKPEELVSHLKYYSGKKVKANERKHPPYYKCDKCDQAFDKSGELTQHRQENH